MQSNTAAPWPDRGRAQKALDLATSAPQRPGPIDLWHCHDLFLEPASTRTIRPTRAGQPVNPSGPFAHGWQQQWFEDRAPGEAVWLAESTQLAPGVYAACTTQGSRRQWMAAKVHIIGTDAMHQMGGLIGRRLALVPPWDTSSLILRNVLFSSLTGSPTHPRRVLVSPTAMMTLHPLAHGDAFHLLPHLRAATRPERVGICLRLAMDLAKQLQVLEDCCVVHNDIKPENILFWQDGSFFLSDFSSAYGAWEAGDLDVADLDTTPQYAPYDELLADDGPVGMLASPYAKDVFSLGVTLITLLSGTDFFALRTELTAAALVTRQHVWRAVYAEIVAFSGSPDGVMSASFIPSDAIERSWVARFGACLTELKQQSPQLLPILVSMVHPDVNARISVAALHGALGRIENQAVPSRAAISAWLRRVPCVHADKLSLFDSADLVSQGARPTSLRRRSTVSGGPARNPWDDARLDGLATFERAWALHDVTHFGEALMMRRRRGSAQSGSQAHDTQSSIISLGSMYLPMSSTDEDTSL